VSVLAIYCQVFMVFAAAILWWYNPECVFTCILVHPGTVLGWSVNIKIPCWY